VTLTVTKTRRDGLARTETAWNPGDAPAGDRWASLPEVAQLFIALPFVLDCQNRHSR
jgi:hypothetical protein